MGLVGGGVAGLLLAPLGNSWRGIGGKLGSTAFLGVGATGLLAGSFGAVGSGAHLHAFSAQERVGLMVFAVLGSQALLSVRRQLEQLRP